MINERKLRALRRIVTSNQIASSYWRHNRHTNCYAYALGLDVMQEDICWLAYYGGRIYNHFSTPKINLHGLSNAELIELDFSILFEYFEEIDINDNIMPNDGIKLAFFDEVGDDNYDFHFFKQNPDGIWFHKYGNWCPTCYDESNTIIRNPLEAKLNAAYENYVYQKTYRLVPFK